MNLGYIQVGIRALINAEALNMVESVGNVVRRRTIPVIYRRGPGSYTVRWVPAISGEALAHRYQLEIVNLAKANEKCKDKLDYWSEIGEFLKHFDLNFYKAQCDNDNVPGPKPWECDKLATRYADKNAFSVSDIKEIEKTIVDNSVVEDIGGFLVTQGPVRRTSRVRFSYAIPTEEIFDQAQTDHQMHVRGALQAESLKVNYNKPLQIPYYVQIGAALYGFNVELDLEHVGVYSLSSGSVQGSCDPNERRKIAVKALRPILELEFGAKRSRYLPHGEIELAVAAVTSGPVPLPPASLKLDSFLDETAAKLAAYRKLGVDTKVVVYVPGLKSEYLERVESALKGRGLQLDGMAETVPDFLNALLKAAGLESSEVR